MSRSRLNLNTCIYCSGSVLILCVSSSLWWLYPLFLFWMPRALNTEWSLRLYHWSQMSRLGFKPPCLSLKGFSIVAIPARLDQILGSYHVVIAVCRQMKICLDSITGYYTVANVNIQGCNGGYKGFVGVSVRSRAVYEIGQTQTDGQNRYSIIHQPHAIKIKIKVWKFLPRDDIHIARTMPSQDVCPSVRPSITRRYLHGMEQSAARDSGLLLTFDIPEGDQVSPLSSVIWLTWRRLLQWSADVCIELCNSLNLDFCKVPPQLCD